MSGQLSELRVDSGKRLPTPVIVGMTQGTFAALPIRLHTNNSTAERTSSNDKRMRSSTCIKKLKEEHDKNLAKMLNDALLGGADYPILSAALDIATAVGTGGAGLMFNVATAALSASRASHRVLARDGDEIWRVEEIGRVGTVPTFVMAYFIIDPHRKGSASSQGWLIHENRYKLQG